MSPLENVVIFEKLFVETLQCNVKVHTMIGFVSKNMNSEKKKIIDTSFFTLVIFYELHNVRL